MDATMDQSEATDFVIRELGKLHQKNDIVQKLCDATSMNWGEAERFVQQVEAQNRGKIAQNQTPMVAILGGLTIIAGFAVSIFILYQTLVNGLIIIFLRLPIPYLGNIVYFLIGVGMIAGGLRGIWDTIVRMWNS
jgi:hypothetical protein